MIKAYWWKQAPNFGDSIAPLLIEKLTGIKCKHFTSGQRLVTIGSIIAQTNPSDIIWGSGVLDQKYTNWSAKDKTFLAVRGPITRRYVIGKGGNCPDIYGDPGVLFSKLFPRERKITRELGIIPHMVDDQGWNYAHKKGLKTINVGWDCERFLEELVSCKRVVSSSLHGVIAAESYGIPVTLAKFGPVTDCGKVEDYYAGTGRVAPTSYDWSEAINVKPQATEVKIDPRLEPALLEQLDRLPRV